MVFIESQVYVVVCIAEHGGVHRVKCMLLCRVELDRIN